MRSLLRAIRPMPFSISTKERDGGGEFAAFYLSEGHRDAVRVGCPMPALTPEVCAVAELRAGCSSNTCATWSTPWCNKSIPRTQIVVARSPPSRPALADSCSRAFPDLFQGKVSIVLSDHLVALACGVFKFLAVQDLHCTTGILDELFLLQNTRCHAYARPIRP